MTIGYRRGKAILVELVAIGNGQALERTAALAFLSMQAAAKVDGIELVPNDGFRSKNRQFDLWADYKWKLAEWEKKHGCTLEGWEANPGKIPRPPRVVAVPGFSEHGEGTAVDINRAPGDDPTTAAHDSPIDKWLATNAARFGFVRTVPSEPWHWSYRPTALPIA